MSIYTPSRKIVLVVGNEELSKSVSNAKFTAVRVTENEKAYDAFVGIRPDVVLININNQDSIRLLHRLHDDGLTAIVTAGELPKDPIKLNEIIGRHVAHVEKPSDSTLESLLLRAEKKTVETREEMIRRVTSLNYDPIFRYEGELRELDRYYGEALKKMFLSMPFIGDRFRKESRYGVIVFNMPNSDLKENIKEEDERGVSVFKKYKTKDGHNKVLTKWQVSYEVGINRPTCTHFYIDSKEADIYLPFIERRTHVGSRYARNTFMFGPNCEDLLSILNKSKKEIAKRAKRTLLDVIFDQNAEWYKKMASRWMDNARKHNDVNYIFKDRIEGIKDNYNMSLLASLRSTSRVSKVKFTEEDIRCFINALDINSAVEPFEHIEDNIIFNIGLIDLKPPNISFKLDIFGFGVVNPNQNELIRGLERLDKRYGLREVFMGSYGWNDCSERDGPVQEDLAHMLENPETGLNREERIRYFSRSMHGLFNPVLNGKDSGRLWSPYSKIGIWMAFRKIYLYTEEFMLTNEYNLISEAISKEDFEKQQRAAVEKLHYWARSQKELAAMNHLAVSIMDEDDASFINIERALRENFVNPEKSREYSNNLLSRGLPKNPTTLVEKSLYVHNWLHKFVHLPSSYNLFYQSYLPNPVSVSVVNL